jgi:accessory gene regulator protein AgrB
VTVLAFTTVRRSAVVRRSSSSGDRVQKSFFCWVSLLKVFFVGGLLFSKFFSQSSFMILVLVSSSVLFIPVAYPPITATNLHCSKEARKQGKKKRDMFLLL